MTDSSQWLNPPASLHFDIDDIHLWRATEQDIAAGHESLRSVLSEEERGNAAKFRVEGDRQRFIFCRGAPRLLLSRYTGQPPGQIGFIHGPFGKPSLMPQTTGNAVSQIHFNLSHTSGMALFAFSATTQVGVDVEKVDPSHDWESVARNFFHPGELALIRAADSERRALSGYEIWTCKEACLKATGSGIGGGLEHFPVLVPPASMVQTKIDLPAGISTDPVWLCRLNPGEGFAAALASVGRASRIRTWNS